MRKVIYLLNVDGYAPAITAITYPLIRYYAARIGADLCMIDKRKFPAWPVTYEKLQIYELARARRADWHLYIDSDALVHPETIDFTEHVPKSTVLHNGSDMAAVRWKYDRFFWRDGRHIGSCNWLTLASDWCLELWKPLDDLTPGQAVSRIRPTVHELNSGITPEHLIDDYALSRNIAQYGFKFDTVIDLLKRLGLGESNFFWHAYTIPADEKVAEMKKVLDNWKIPNHIRGFGA